MDRKIDLCKLTDGVMNSLFLKDIMRDIIKSAAFDIQCPYRPGTYLIHNLTIMDIPKLPLQNKQHGCVNITFFGKHYDSKRFYNVGNVKLHVTV